MAPISKRQPKPRSFSSWTLVYAACGALLLAICGFYLLNTPPEPKPMVGVPAEVAMLEIGVPDPVYPHPASIRELDYVLVDLTEGKLVYRIRTTTQGDELVIDATTGKLLAIRNAEGVTLNPLDTRPGAAEKAPM